MDPYKVIKRPIVTEKGHAHIEDTNTYVFEVADEATKTDIRDAVENIWKVKVTDVRTMNCNGKPKRFRFNKMGYTRFKKKAYVRLMVGDAIDALR